MPTRSSPDQIYFSPIDVSTENNEYTIGLALRSPPLNSTLNQDVARSVPRTMTTTMTSPLPAAVTTNTTTVTTSPNQQKGNGITRRISKRLPFLGRSRSKRTSPDQNPSNGGVNSSSRPSADIGIANPSGRPMSLAVSPPLVAAAANPVTQVAPNARRLETAKLKKKKKHADTKQDAQPSAWRPGQSKPQLDVEIPDIKLERYSVMFQSLFEDHQATGGLLARRQPTGSGLRLMQDQDGSERYTDQRRSRRVTSPAYQTPQSPHVGLTRPRSRTFPALNREVDLGGPSVNETGSLSMSSAQSSAIGQVSPVRDNEDRPRLRSRFHKSSQDSIPSPYAGQTASDKENGTALSPPPGQASRRVLDKQPKTAAGGKGMSIPQRSTSLRNPKASMAALSSALTPPHRKSRSKEYIMDDTAEVSIARQVSISRHNHQRRYLEPLHEREMRRDRARATQNIKTTSKIFTLDSNTERIAETKTGTPTFIHPEHHMSPHDPSSPDSLLPHYLKHRKSECVIIEGA